MRINQLKLGAFLSYFQMALGIVVSLIYTPLMIKLLGKSEYGLYNTVSSTISMLSILSLGFNSSYIKFYSKYKKNNDYDAINKLNGLFLIVFMIIGTIAFLCGLFLTQNLNLIYADGLTESEFVVAKDLMFLLTINLAISFPMSVFGNIVLAHERFVFSKLLLIFKTVVSPLLTIPLLLSGFGSISIVFVTLVISVSVDTIYLIYCLAKLKVKFTFKNFEKGIFKDLFIFTSFIALNIIVDQINLNIDKLLLGRFKGTEMVAIYSVGFTLYMYFQQFSTAVSSVFSPRVHMLVNTYSGQEQRNKLTSIFTKIGRIQFAILGLICTGFIFFGMPFILYVWAGPGYEDSYYVMLLLSIPSMISLIQNVGIEIQRAEDKHKFRSIAYFCMALINLVISIFLCQLYGAIGSAIGTAISIIVANGIIMNVYYYKRCNIDVVYFWKSILRMSLGMAVPIAIGIILFRFVDLTSVLTLFFSILVYSLVYFISFWLFAFNKEEKNLIKTPLTKLFKKD